MSPQSSLVRAVALIDSATRSPEPAIPGAIAVAVDRTGDIIFSHASGSIKAGSGAPMTFDTVLWLASCTKVITGIACMQLVEQEKRALDDPAQLGSLVPELKELKVLTKDSGGNFVLVPQEQHITLRMLLTHTAGFGYAFSDADLCAWARPIGLDDFSGKKTDVLHRPLLFQPGTAFQYGVNVDWAGVVIERATKMSLERYFRTFIFEPLGMRDVSFFPSAEIKSRLVYMHHRGSGGLLSDWIICFDMLWLRRKRKGFV